MGVYSFRKDLETAKKVEKQFVKKLQTKFPKTYRKTGNFKYYDVVVPELDKKIELKFDEMFKDTGNFFIECESRNEPSGITITKSTHWTTIYDDEKGKKFSKTIETEKLKKIIEEKKPRKVMGGDKDPETGKKTSWGYLVKLKDIK